MALVPLALAGCGHGSGGPSVDSRTGAPAHCSNPLPPDKAKLSQAAADATEQARLPARAAVTYETTPNDGDVLTLPDASTVDPRQPLTDQQLATVAAVLRPVTECVELVVE
ncbi:MAG: hypothetical protein FWD74_12785, partial [Actinomycetia bacterium]|nr:hypothetical protein [Actinomycetes bacterium]